MSQGNNARIARDKMSAIRRYRFAGIVGSEWMFAGTWPFQARPDGTTMKLAREELGGDHAHVGSARHGLR